MLRETSVPSVRVAGTALAAGECWGGGEFFCSASVKASVVRSPAPVVGAGSGEDRRRGVVGSVGGVASLVLATGAEEMEDGVDALIPLVSLVGDEDNGVGAVAPLKSSRAGIGVLSTGACVDPEVAPASVVASEDVVDFPGGVNRRCGGVGIWT